MKKKEHMTMQIVIIILYATLEIIESAPSSIISTSTNLKSIPSTSTNLNSTQLSNINSAINTLNSISNMVISNPNSSLPLSSTSNNQTNSTSSSRNETINVPMFQKKSSSGLSAGAICAIIIPTIAALLAVAAIAALLKGATAPVVAAPFQASLPLESSVAKFNAVQEIPVQQPQLVKVQPIKENTQVNYPVQRVIEPPKVVSPQPAQLVPVQEVQMVPVQEVQMVPVQQVDMVPVQQVVTEVKEVQVLPTQVLPTVTS